MRKIVSFCLLLAGAVSCNQAEKPAETSTAKPNYAYTIDKPDNWDMVADPKNTEIAMNALKAFEENKLDECASYFADSVRWRFDYVDVKLGKDSLKSFISEGRKTYASLKVNMHDFESVVSKDKKENYVTMWYTQVFTDASGKVDSTAIINDIKIENGKIVELSEASRHFPVKK
jgi:hypothetical protein